jgi:hypothetical protein
MTVLADHSLLHASNPPKATTCSDICSARTPRASYCQDGSQGVSCGGEGGGVCVHVCFADVWRTLFAAVWSLPPVRVALGGLTAVYVPLAHV